MVDNHKKVYIRNAIWLAILTVMELGVIQLPIAKTGQVVILLALAVTKIMLVALIYMHLRYETKVLRRILVLPIPVAILFTVALMYDLPFRWVF